MNNFIFAEPGTTSRPAKLKALDWSQAEIEELATITTKDIKAAAEAWREFAPVGWKTLLDAESDKEI